MPRTPAVVGAAVGATTRGTFFLALAGHVGLVLKHQVINRDRLLSRMT